MESTVHELFPEIQEISDETLRSQVTAVWAEALETGGWSAEDVKSIPFTLLAENVQITYWEHVRTVCRMCIEMHAVLEKAYGERYRGDRDTLIAGALLADVGKMLEYERKDGQIVQGHRGQMLRHPFSGVGLCFKHGVPDEVMHVVATHSREGDHVKRSPESIIFHHADFTDFELVK
jgi:putative nucleotidyltransferase with HDIG domain